jgi:hypothetical protein
MEFSAEIETPVYLYISTDPASTDSSVLEPPFRTPSHACNPTQNLSSMEYTDGQYEVKRVKMCLC